MPSGSAPSGPIQPRLVRLRPDAGRAEVNVPSKWPRIWDCAESCSAPVGPSESMRRGCCASLPRPYRSLTQALSTLCAITAIVTRPVTGSLVPITLLESDLTRSSVTASAAIRAGERVELFPLIPSLNFCLIPSLNPHPCHCCTSFDSSAVNKPRNDQTRLPPLCEISSKTHERILPFTK